MSAVCDNCKRPPEPFQANTEDGEETGYFFGVPKENDDPVIVTSDLEEKFFIMTKPNPAPHELYWFWCVRCVQATGDESNDPL